MGESQHRESRIGGVKVEMVAGIGNPSETLVSLDQDSCLENPWTEEPGGQQSIGVAKSWREALAVCTSPALSLLQRGLAPRSKGKA